jgi:hypothetical protein
MSAGRDFCLGTIPIDLLMGALHHSAMRFLTSFARLLGAAPVNNGVGRHRLPRHWWKIEGFFPLATGGELEVVGESHFQETFEKIVGTRWSGGVYWHVVAQLFFIDDNPADSNAVGVMIEGMPAGYVPAREAMAFRAAILEANPDRLPVICKGEIRGGFVKGSRKGSYGLTLDVCEPLRQKAR